MVTLIISGGQTGADQGALRAAVTLGIPTGGWAPKGYLTETGPNFDLRDVYGLMEHETSHDYAPRTKDNVQLADATLILGRRSRGSNLTERLCQLLGKPFLWVTMPEMPTQAGIVKCRLWLARTELTCLNVAGNRESVSPGLCQLTAEYLEWVLG